MVSEFTNSQEVEESEIKVNFKVLYKLKDGLKYTSAHFFCIYSRLNYHTWFFLKFPSSSPGAELFSVLLHEKRQFHSLVPMQNPMKELCGYLRNLCLQTQLLICLPVPTWESRQWCENVEPENVHTLQFQTSPSRMCSVTRSFAVPVYLPQEQQCSSLSCLGVTCACAI